MIIIATAVFRGAPGPWTLDPCLHLEINVARCKAFQS